jgi:enediyne biosynthesis protein E5
MITDPGTTPMKPRPQFMFGSAVAVVYGVLMLMNIVYTLFFATVIVCAGRGLGWWATYAWKKWRERRAPMVAATGDSQVGSVEVAHA